MTVDNQGELEHRRAKARYKRTSKKNYVKQLAQIERRQSRLLRIRKKTGGIRNAATPSDSGSKDLRTHFHIGVSENEPQPIGQFLRMYAGDPAIKVTVLPCYHAK
jgi:sRNA-binding protein